VKSAARRNLPLQLIPLLLYATGNAMASSINMMGSWARMG